MEEATSGHAAEVELVEVAVVALLCLKLREEVKLLILHVAVQGGEQVVVEVDVVLLASIAVRLGTMLQVAQGDQTMAQLEGDKIGQEEDAVEVGTGQDLLDSMLCGMQMAMSIILTMKVKL